MAKRIIEPFMVSKEDIDDYLFTHEQKLAYAQLVKAAAKCEKVGLTLIAKQD